MVSEHNPLSKGMVVILTALTLAAGIAGTVIGGDPVYLQMAGVFGAIDVAAVIAAVIIHTKAKKFDQKITEEAVRKELAQFIKLTEEDGNKEFFKAMGQRIKLD